MVIYNNYDIVFQEIPNEVSLAFTLKRCPNLCRECHSPYLRELVGDELTITKLIEILEIYKNDITNVLFLGGDREPLDLIPLLIKCKEFGLKTSWYSGNDDLRYELVKHLDYYKIGSYDNELGGLSMTTTNQKLHQIKYGNMKDITELFWK